MVNTTRETVRDKFTGCELIFTAGKNLIHSRLFTNVANPKNPNLNLDCTDYADFCL